ncbi:MAG: tRNA 2-thiouridine(34) synthase MnmA [Candidatus Vogelbacteria bacterium RIFOXYD1_FULL_46_19]|uniref:tRNA-specific 2-thiouridylase MnmA n=1 Tax=Candidatus Vogelbacteria bacterium RIFOXYD1_FULL_46_19 TaxID=1802439 RepID=A0A1G2QFV3_9BACT|nr:MAG: tRNA 2-thiouridine(34) synthase MnmA [Candidatus Vogelbacteria bacterium RIFOXYD1_FULL_46_19]
MSGGVDSSVAAALLVEQNYEVTGVFIKVWEPPNFSCTWRDDRRDAMRVAAQLSIPFITLDLSAEYKQGVVDYMIAEYQAGRTPNPDVMCNKTVKFGAFFNWARNEGVDYVATGHYAQIISKGNQFELHAGLDPTKDQSYFLWSLAQTHLAHTLFPVGHYPKKEVRALAEKFQLPTATKKDSQGLCFIGKLNVKDFLKNFIEAKPGEVITESGEVVGRHDGVFFYTLGERHGFTVTQKTTAEKPYYIVAKDLDRNRLIVATDPKSEEMVTKTARLTNTNWNTSPPASNKTYQVQLRYHGECLPVTLASTADGYVVSFVEPVLATPGQSLVVYEGSQCLGGGIII